MKERLAYMDSLRGLAVLLMVQQHLQAWLWSIEWISYSYTWPGHPVMLSLHFTGWFAAPLFVILAGAGAALMHESGRPSPEYIRRGLMIVACGYLLNIITPNWFRPESWYILHTIGTAIILAPLLLKLSNLLLALFTVSAVIIPALLQTWLNTPLMPGNIGMNDSSLPGGILRLALSAGHFPIFPWIGFFAAGIISRRLIIAEKKRIILYASIILTGTAILPAAIYNRGYFFATGGRFFRFFVPLPFFYPPLPVFILFIMGITLFLFFIFSKNSSLFSATGFSPLNAPGRSSLSWFMIHIVLFNQAAWLCGLYQRFSAGATLCITLAFITVMVFLSLIWKRYNFRFGMEWTIRRITSIKS